MKTKTIEGKTLEEIKKALKDCLSEDFNPSLAIIFMSITHDIDAVCNIFNNEQIRIFGSTSSGEFISEEIIEGGIVAMLLDINPEHFELFFHETGEDSDFEMAKQLGREGKATFENAVFIIASGWSNDIDGDEIIKGIEEGFAGETTIFGGMAGDDLKLTEPKVFTHGKISKSGLMGLIIDGDKLNVSGVATCGWKPVGITRTITKSNANVIYTIDDKPALDLVMKYLGLTVDEKLLNNVVFNLGAYYPLQIQKEEGPPVMRTAMFGNTQDRSLICAGNVPEGSEVRLSLPPDFDAIDTVEEECVEIKHEQIKEADAVIMFSCISRYLSFGVMTGEEIKRVQSVWNVPMVGFFSYGEYGKSKTGGHEFYNNTCCVVAIKEK